MKIQCTENGNDIYCHPVHTVELRLVVVEPSRETRIGLKNQVVHEIRETIRIGLS